MFEGEGRGVREETDVGEEKKVGEGGGGGGGLMEETQVGGGRWEGGETEIRLYTSGLFFDTYILHTVASA